MSTHQILTMDDLADFIGRLEATVAAAGRGAELESLLARVMGADGARLATAKSSSRGGSARAVKKATPKAPVVDKRNSKRAKSIEGGKIVEVLTGAKDGMTVAQVADALGEKDHERVRYAINKLREKKSVEMTGSRISARYHAA